MSLAILVPVLARPERVYPLLRSIEETTPPPWRAVFVLDAGDDDEYESVAASRASYPVDLLVGLDGARYAAKINAAVAATDEPWIFQGADDLAFRPHWWDAAIDVARYTGARVVGTNDLCNDRTMVGIHSTHSLVARTYVDEVGGVIDRPPGILMCEEYEHEYSDDEMIQTAMTRGEYAHAHLAGVQHLHPNCGTAPDDPTYVRGRAGTARSRVLFRRRAHLWGGDRSTGRRRRIR